MYISTELSLSFLMLKLNVVVSPAPIQRCSAKDALVHTPSLFFTTARAHASTETLDDSFVTGTLILFPFSSISLTSGCIPLLAVKFTLYVFFTFLLPEVIVIIPFPGTDSGAVISYDAPVSSWRVLVFGIVGVSTSTVTFFLISSAVYDAGTGILFDDAFLSKSSTFTPFTKTSEIFAFSKYASSPVDGGVIAFTSSVERSKSISSIFNGSSHGVSSVSEVGLAPK